MVKLDIVRKTYDISLISFCFLKNTFCLVTQNLNAKICFSDLSKTVGLKQILLADKVKLKNGLILKKTPRENEVIFSPLFF
tara:strand:+ start:9083 stop:9325 length:243 start_codon:yes stop_codon:yes gene_type:complete